MQTTAVVIMLLVYAVPIYVATLGSIGWKDISMNGQVNFSKEDLINQPKLSISFNPSECALDTASR